MLLWAKLSTKALLTMKKQQPTLTLHSFLVRPARPFFVFIFLHSLQSMLSPIISPPFLPQNQVGSLSLVAIKPMCVIKMQAGGYAAEANIWFYTDYLGKEGLLLLATQEINITQRPPRCQSICIKMMFKVVYSVLCWLDAFGTSLLL